MTVGAEDHCTRIINQVGSVIIERLYIDIEQDLKFKKINKKKLVVLSQ